MLKPKKNYSSPTFVNTPNFSKSSISCLQINSKKLIKSMYSVESFSKSLQEEKPEEPLCQQKTLSINMYIVKPLRKLNKNNKNSP